MLELSYIVLLIIFLPSGPGTACDPDDVLIVFGLKEPVIVQYNSQGYQVVIIPY
jgi:hypothetical protein